MDHDWLGRTLNTEFNNRVRIDWSRSRTSKYSIVRLRPSLAACSVTNLKLLVPWKYRASLAGIIWWEGAVHDAGFRSDNLGHLGCQLERS